MKETLRHIEAFEYYYSNGNDRSYEATATKYGVGKSSIFNWAKAFDWRKRVHLRDLAIAKRIEKKNIKTVAETKADYRKIVSVLISKAIEEIKAGRLVPVTVQDVEKVVKLGLLLIGEATERIENNEYIAEFGTTKTDEETAD